MADVDKPLKIKSENAGDAPDSRRRFLKGAAGAAPILMTVASRPVLGAQCTPSAWVSGNLSDHGHTRLSCGGRSPGYWKARPRRWDVTHYRPGTCKEDLDYRHSTCTAYKGDGTAFNAVFPAGNSYYDGKTLMQVLWLDGGGDPYQLGAHIVAALLNADSIADYGMKPEDVIEIYRQLVTTGMYKPSAGDSLTAQDVVLFIQNTFDDTL
jgi:hypothetical protein